MAKYSRSTGKDVERAMKRKKKASSNVARAVKAAP
jgi:hypothetical protein